MKGLSLLILVLLLVLAVLLLFRLIKLEIRFIFKFLIHAALGFVILILLNFFGSWLNISLELSWINCAVSGFFGIPGVIVLLLLKYLL